MGIRRGARNVEDGVAVLGCSAQGNGWSSLLLSMGLSLYTLATNGQTAPVIYGRTATIRIASGDDIEMQPLNGTM
jgi:hypothetical protein